MTKKRWQIINRLIDEADAFEQQENREPELHEFALILIRIANELPEPPHHPKED